MVTSPGHEFQLPRNLVCSFDVSCQLLQQGIELTSFFYYLHFENTGKHFVYRNKTAFRTMAHNRGLAVDCRLIPAPLSEEIQLLMPVQVYTWCKPDVNSSTGMMWYCRLMENGSASEMARSAPSQCKAGVVMHGKNEATVRGKMLGYLKKGRA